MKKYNCVVCPIIMGSRKTMDSGYPALGGNDIEMAQKLKYVRITYFSPNPTLSLCDSAHKTLFGDVSMSLNWSSSSVFTSRIVLPSLQRRALLLHRRGPGLSPLRRQDRRKMTLPSVTLTACYPGLPRVWPSRALKLLNKMKFVDYQWVSITVSVLSWTPSTINSWELAPVWGFMMLLHWAATPSTGPTLTARY